MPITATDLEQRLSGGSANADPNASLGGALSSTVIATGVKNNVFDDVTSTEATAGDTEYRGIYARNGHATLSWQNVVAWIDSLTVSPSTEFDIGVAVEAVGVTMATIANESTPPTGVTFSRPTTKATGLSVGNLPAAGGNRGLWVRRTVTAGAAVVADSGSVRFEGDTGP